MRRRIVIVPLFAAVAIFAVQGKVAGQQEPTGTKAAAAQRAPEPYTATYRIAVIGKQPDGSTKTRQSTETIALDSEGRRMDRTSEMPIAGAPAPMMHIRVDDPVARSSSIWGVPGKQVLVIAMAAPGARPDCPPRPVATPRPMPPVQDLGTQKIQGVQARGRRTVFAIPPGAAGSNQSQQPTLEVWTAIDPGLEGLLVREISVDPRGSQTSRELETVTKGEPNPSLFHPPAGYRIVNRPAPVPRCPSGVQAPEN